VKYLYKIYSNYDGFTPARIPERTDERKLLRLGWERYIDAVHLGEEVWIYFFGPHRFENGVYVKGIVSRIDAANRFVWVRIREHSTEHPLTDAATSLRVAAAVVRRNVQVFLLPTEWAVEPECTVDANADSCRNRQCEGCPTWQALPKIADDDCGWPTRLSRRFEAFAPALWVIPARCYWRARDLTESVRRGSELFYRFKTGEGSLAFPLALAIYEVLKEQERLEFDCVVPIPLSPDKEQAGEINRTRLLARELATLLGVRVADVLSLSGPISKRRFLSAGLTQSNFEYRYYHLLQVQPEVTKFARILVLDDVCTQGSTLDCALRKIRELHPNATLTAATAGQMILKGVVADPATLML